MDEAFAHVEGGVIRNKRGLIPPDGGWGYVIGLGVGFTFMLGFGSSNAFGILFNDFFLEQDGASGLPLVIGVYNGALSFAGFLSGIALKKYSFRQVGLFGAALFVLGDVLTIFVQKTYQLAITFGVIRGSGFGVMIPVSFTAFNCYFTKKRTAMMSANQTMSSMASITFPMLVTFLLSEYGFRWTLALIMAIDLHLVFAMLVMHPVEWHLIKSGEPTSETELPLKCDVLSVRKIHSDNDDSFVKMLSGDVEEIKENKKNNRHESIQKSIIKVICDNVELDLLKDPRFVSTLVGIGFAFVSDVTYLAMEPMLLFSYGFSQMEVATCVMVGALADLLARFAFAVFTYFFVVDSKKLFYIGTCITILLRIALVSSSDLWYVFTVTALSGLVRCTVQVLFPLVLVAAAPDRFPAALALHILFSGVLMLMADPLIGVLYDATGSYMYCFLAMSICCLVCIVLWTIEYIVYREKRS
ncbi:monocarboxylate transporter 7-like isoform X1 [Plodia interpunctella]|uniref:monocarboxylate transporter 7-like isoform X1 n=1 Tax=Plodia interpunctella TaxID=58824 RepID=UPI0023684CF8|nr:monocarboxylate transporter 7-like isoform X1 [Plodia interpunctella]